MTLDELQEAHQRLVASAHMHADDTDEGINRVWPDIVAEIEILTGKSYPALLKIARAAEGMTHMCARDAMRPCSFCDAFDELEEL